MNLSSDLISDFVKATKDETETKKETTRYGTIVVNGDGTFVQLDGSERLTPIEKTATVKNNDRVTVMIKDHSAIVTGNLTNNSVGQKTVISEINGSTEGITINANKLNVTDIFAQNITATGEINFSNGEYRIEGSNQGVEIEAFRNLEIDAGLNLALKTSAGYMTFSAMGTYCFDGDEVDPDRVVLDIWDSTTEQHVYHPFLNTYNTPDHVTERGSSGIWSYRKWSSGDVELWGRLALDPGYLCSTSFGNGFYRTSAIAIPNYPFTFFTAPVVEKTYEPVEGVGAMIWVTGAGSTTNSGSVCLVRPNSGTTLYGYINLYVKGRIS